MQSTEAPCLTETEGQSSAAESAGSTGVVVEASHAESNATQDACPHCGAQSYSRSTWCKFCGYYATLGRCIELAEWEKEVENGEYNGPKEEPIATFLYIPFWAWQLAAALIGVGGISVAGRFMTVPDSTPRACWSICQVAAGLTAFLVVHFRLAHVALSQDKSLQLSDVLMAPTRIWISACLDFQRLSRWVAIGFAGIWATLLAHVLLGVPYNDLFTHENPTPKKETQGSAVAAKGAGQGSKQMTMEEAMDELSEKSGAKQMAGDGASSNKGVLPPGTSDPKEKAPAIQELDCLIVGYKPGTEGGNSILSLVVAVKTDGQWTVVGTVSNGLTPEIQRELIESAKSLRRDRPFVECNDAAIWLEPVLRCRIEAEVLPGQSKPANMKLLGLK